MLPIDTIKNFGENNAPVGTTKVLGEKQCSCWNHQKAGKNNFIFEINKVSGLYRVDELDHSIHPRP